MTNLFDYFHFNLLSSMLAAPRTCHSTESYTLVICSSLWSWSCLMENQKLPWPLLDFLSFTSKETYSSFLHGHMLFPQSFSRSQSHFVKLVFGRALLIMSSDWIHVWEGKSYKLGICRNLSKFVSHVFSIKQIFSLQVV